MKTGSSANMPSLPAVVSVYACHKTVLSRTPSRTSKALSLGMLALSIKLSQPNRGTSGTLVRQCAQKNGRGGAGSCGVWGYRVMNISVRVGASGQVPICHLVEDTFVRVLLTPEEHKVLERMRKTCDFPKMRSMNSPAQGSGSYVGRGICVASRVYYLLPPSHAHTHKHTTLSHTHTHTLSLPLSLLCNSCASEQQRFW